MPIINTWESEGLHMNYCGFNHGKDILEHVIALSSDSRIDDIKYIIGDFSLSTGLDATEEDVKVLAAYNTALSKTNPNILNPTVLPADEHSQSLVSFYVLITEDIAWGTGWVRSLEEARQWIVEQKIKQRGSPAFKNRHQSL